MMIVINDNLYDISESDYKNLTLAREKWVNSDNEMEDKLRLEEYNQVLDTIKENYEPVDTIGGVFDGIY